MDDRKLFSQFYSTVTTKNEDKPKFRNRLLKYLEDFVNSGWPVDTFRLCRHVMGVDIKQRPRDRVPNQSYYCVEETFNSADIPVKDILDFITIIYDSLLPRLDDKTVSSKDKLAELIPQVNRIFQEESMCYVLHENGRVRYYPDDEFHRTVKATLVILNKPQYKDNLKLFNDVLNDLYRNHGKESPIHEFFKCVETFALSLINDDKFNRLNNPSIDFLMKKLITHIDSDSLYATHDKEAASSIQEIFSTWVNMCHKYRHGKADQVNNDVPPALFNFIFTIGISIFRFLLEINDKYAIRS